MAIFVHLTSAANAARIRRAGLRADSWARTGERGVYCFPVLPSFTVTHQWLRELARRGTRGGGMVAVHLRLDDDEPVLVGHYAGRGKHAARSATAAEAVHRIRELDDPRGWEVFVPRAVTAGEVRRVRAVPQGVGWRYFPGAHGTRPCTCFGCRVRGEYGGRRLRERLPHPLDGPDPKVPVLLERLAAAGEPGDPKEVAEVLYWFARRRRGPVEALIRLTEHPDARIREDLVWAVGGWRSPGVGELLERLAGDPVAEVREAAAQARSDG
ncbi:HEAT repeat domain-containing protein [Kitasatospora sp. NPDC051853]|uniref:HEAT repeat domain-containing protein n=1 Tax=Kitasatospora sp. NPDC051853 TaxID=3364058 RepID=UPI0037A9C2E8